MFKRLFGSYDTGFTDGLKMKMETLPIQAEVLIITGDIQRRQLEAIRKSGLHFKAIFASEDHTFTTLSKLTDAQLESIGLKRVEEPKAYRL